MADTQWHRTMHVNLDSIFGVVQAAVAQFKKQGRPAKNAASGWIVLISSTAAQRGEAMHADYAASEGAIISFTKSLSSELIRDGIHVNCVAPGWVDTDMSAATLRDPQKREKGSVGDPGWTRRDSGGDCRAGVISLHSVGRFRQRRGLQRQRRIGADRLGRTTATGMLPGAGSGPVGCWLADGPLFGFGLEWEYSSVSAWKAQK